MASNGTDDVLASNPSDHGGALPKIDVRHVQSMTDRTGMFQHALYSLPDLDHGYCIDDNARALIAAMIHTRLSSDETTPLAKRCYLAFLAHAYNESVGKFRNFMAYDRRWLEEVGSPDSQGRTIWALGITVSHALDADVRDLADDLFTKALPGIESFCDLRSKAFAVLGIEAYLQKYPAHDSAGTKASGPASELRDRYAHEIYCAFSQHGTDDWPWCENLVTYDNAKLCQAMLEAGQSMGRLEVVEQGLKSLKWLLEVQRAPDGHLSIIGNDGWLPRGGERAAFDQQPLEAHAMVQACLTAAHVSGNSTWADEARRCFQWFTGGNDLGVPLYDPKTGGCKDGLNPEGANRNQGAESTLAYLLSVMELHRHHGSQV